jgi:HK97 family phage major capsid protein
MSGINTNRTNISLPAEVSAEIITKVQEESAIMRLAKPINLPGRGLTIPVIAGDPEANWVDETNAKPVSNPTLSQKNMKGYTLAVIVPFSNQFKRDAQALYAEIVSRLPKVLGNKFDATIFHGTAPGTGFDVLTGCTAETISGTGKSFYKALVNSDVAIAAAGYAVNGYAMSPQARGEMLLAEDNNKRPLFVNNVAEGGIPRLLGQPVYYTRGVYGAGDTNDPDVLGVAGDWTQARYGIVQGVDVSISDQATLTISNSQVNLWERNMFAIRAEIEVGFIATTDAFRKIVRDHA